MANLIKKAKAYIKRQIIRKIWSLSNKALENKYKMFFGETILGNEYTKTLECARLNFDCALNEFFITVLKLFLPEHFNTEK